MIKFFRKIRQQLLSENRITTYFLYAIGEIFLVMVGILLALQVNNWNEDRKLEQKESVYLKGLKQNLLESKKELNRVIEESDITANSINYLVKVVRDNEQIGERALDSLIMKAMGYTKYQTRQGVIDELTSSGQVSIIKSDYLRTEIASWNANLINIREAEEMGKDAFFDYSDRLSKYFDFSGMTSDEKVFNAESRALFLSDINTRNTLAQIRYSSQALNEAYLEKREHIDTLIIVINKELE